MTIDLGPVSAATIGETRPMPNLEAELADFGGKKCFTWIDFCNPYCQIPLDKDSPDPYGIKLLQGTFTHTRVLHGLKML